MTLRAALVVCVLAAVAWADEPAGLVAALEGKAEVLHAGTQTWTGLAAGDALAVADQVRTLPDSRLKLLFPDDTVMTLAPSSELTIEQPAGPAGAPSSRFKLLLGTVKAVVTERYAQPGARFELETPTAIAGVHGTGFIAEYDGSADETLVVGLFDTTLVRAVNDPGAAREVKLGAGESTRVRRGSYPLAPTLLPEGTLRGLEQTTTVPPGAGPSAGGPRALHRGSAEPRMPNAPGERAISNDGVVDQPLEQLDRTRHGVAPPPPPVPPPHR